MSVERYGDDVLAAVAKAFSYDATTGIIRRKTTTGSRWRAGDVLQGVPCREFTMTRIKVAGVVRKIYFHQIAWVISYGIWPEYVRFKNGDKSDCRLENLFEAQDFQHQQLKHMSRSNRSGAKGVSWIAEKQRWRAEIRAFGKRKHIGYFDNVFEAAAAYADAAEEMHGDFALADTNEGIMLAHSSGRKRSSASFAA